VVEPEADPPAEQSVIDHVRERLAGYKVPRRVLAVDTIDRAPNGKVDYKRLREQAAASV
jgi:3-oxocholest-4-en-26-oate---CoA ligase